MKNFRNVFITLLLILNCFFTIFLIRDDSIIEVNSNNKDYINSLTNNMCDNSDDIIAIGVGSGFHSGVIYVYHMSSKKETLYPGTANFELDKLSSYIEDNGFDCSYISLYYGIFAISILFLFLSYQLIKFIIKKKKVIQF